RNELDPTNGRAAFDTGEIAIDTVAMAMSIRRRIAEDPRIDVRTSRKIAAVEEHGPPLRAHSTGVDSGDSDRESFSSVVNALWDGRLAIDAIRGVHPDRKWIH